MERIIGWRTILSLIVGVISSTFIIVDNFILQQIGRALWIIAVTSVGLIFDNKKMIERKDETKNNKGLS